MAFRSPARYLLAPVLAMSSVGLLSCGRQESAAPDTSGQLRVFVSIPPQKYFVERIGGEHVDVHVLVGPGQSPHTFEPTARQVVELSEADVYFRVGVPFERQLADKIEAALADLTVVDTSEGIEFRSVQATSVESIEPDPGRHVHGPECDHDPDGALDAHTWLSPRLALVHARNIRDALSRLDRDHSEIYARNFEQLEADLREVDREIANALAPLAGRELFVFHPAFGYFAEAYGLKQVAIEMGGRQPTARHLDKLIARARQAGVRVVFVQPQFSKQGAEAVARAIGGAVIPLDPLAEDYVANLRHVADAIRDALGTSSEDQESSP